MTNKKNKNIQKKQNNPLGNMDPISQIREFKENVNELNDNFNGLSIRQKAWYEPYFNYQKALFHFHQMDYNKSRKFTMLAIDNYSGELDVILGNLYLLNGKLNDIVNNCRTQAENEL